MDLPDIDTVPHHDAVEDMGKSIYNAVTLPGDVYKGDVDLNSEEGIERTFDLAYMGLSKVPKVGASSFVPHHPSAEGILSPEAHEAFRQFDATTGYHEGPSPFEQVASAARRARPEDETDRALRAIHEALYPETRNPPGWERAGGVGRQEPYNPATSRESYDQLMDRLDRQDAANISFKDYGKVQVADRGYGSFLFKAGNSKALPLNVSERENGRLLSVGWIGDLTGEAINTFDKGAIKGLFKALAEKYPDAEEIAGLRISGARAKSGGGFDTARMRIPGRGKKTTYIPPDDGYDLSPSTE